MKKLGIITMAIGMLILLILIPESLSMSNYRHEINTVRNIGLILIIIYGLTYIVAGTCAVFFKSFSNKIYLAALIVTITEYIYNIILIFLKNKNITPAGLLLSLIILTLFFYIIPFMICIFGIIVSKKYKN
jgi:hypothetical protein